MPTLGDFLRLRRGMVRPEDAGFPAAGRRRVAGLRREEVAVAAGISADYYVRLEQGRETTPSPQVLDALARLFGLDDDARQHLYRLAGLAPIRTPRRTIVVPRRAPRAAGVVGRPPCRRLGRGYDVLAANELGLALFAGSPFADNFARMLFLDPAATGFWDDWSAAASATVAGLLLASSDSPDDARLAEVVEELRRESASFADLWRETSAQAKRLRAKSFHHPVVGDLDFRVHAFEVRAAAGTGARRLPGGGGRRPGRAADLRSVAAPHAAVADPTR